jgi:hypothetical protein
VNFTCMKIQFSERLRSEDLEAFRLLGTRLQTPTLIGC